LVVLYIPARFEVNQGAFELTRERYALGRRFDREVVHDRLRQGLDRIGVPLIDPRNELRASESAGRPAYHTRDVHWNPRGNEISAAAIRAWVERECPALK